MRLNAQQVGGMFQTRPKPCGRRCRSPHPARNHGGAMLGHRPQNLGVTKPRLSVGVATATGCGVFKHRAFRLARSVARAVGGRQGGRAMRLWVAPGQMDCWLWMLRLSLWLWPSAPTGRALHPESFPTSGLSFWHRCGLTFRAPCARSPHHRQATAHAPRFSHAWTMHDAYKRPQMQHAIQHQEPPADQQRRHLARVRM